MQSRRSGSSAQMPSTCEYMALRPYATGLAGFETRVRPVRRGGEVSRRPRRPVMLRRPLLQDGDAGAKSL